MFVDGACSRNGYVGAVSGLGGIFSPVHEQGHWSIPVSPAVDTNPLRTNSRAELLASIEGVRRFGAYLRQQPRLPGSTDRNVIVATDSEYVVNGITEYMPEWKV